ncbi:protein ACCELERATED CELL DEATH 6 [Hevea brasiliensis]|uniref:protein ACCELERATED CELL DEATH 6 n=1 Tax=Hevea brasiliensis TaxID=3981 RepID=UPI0025E0BF71|nr:protein ACCELERATED CELL DEATH 6 [Hevea brasiliensis]
MADSQVLPETQLASEINDQPKQKHIITFMDAKWYNAAAEGQINKFKDYTEPLDLLRTPNKSTILHVYITSIQNETEESIEFVKLVITKCPSLLVEPNIRDLTRKLLNKNSSLTREQDEEGWTPLHYASYFNLLPIVEMLLEDDNKSAAYISEKDGKTPLHLAILNGDSHLKVVEKIMSDCPDCCDLADNRGRNVLHFAVESGSFKGVQIITEKPSLANLINQKDKEGNTPVHLVAALGFEDCCLTGHHLVDKMAANNENLTALDVVLETKHKSKLPLPGLTARFLKNAGYKRGRPVILLKSPDSMSIVDNELIRFTVPGCYSGIDGPDEGTAILTRRLAFKTFIVTDTLALALSISVVLIHFLLALQPTNRKIFFLFTWAFIVTVAAMELMVVAFMTEFDKSTAYIGEKDGKTPLHLAIVRGGSHLKVVKKIMSDCPDCCDLTDKSGRNALHFAVKSKSFRGVKTIIEKPSLANLINQKDIGGNTPVHLLAAFGSPGLSDFRTRKPRMVGYKRGRHSKLLRTLGIMSRLDSVPLSDLRKASESYNVVATLMATVTFAAGFTLPGGFSDHDGPDEGTAILSRKAAFKIFLITDALAFSISIAVVFINSSLTFFHPKRRNYYTIFFAVTFYTVFAMALMAVAFMTGVYAVIPHSSSGLGAAICVIIS